MSEKTYLRVVLEDAERGVDGGPNNGYRYIAHAELTPLLNELHMFAMDQVMGYWDLMKVVCEQNGDAKIIARRLDTDDPSESEVGTWMNEQYRIPAEVIDAENPMFAARVVQQRQLVKTLTNRYVKALNEADAIGLKLDRAKAQLVRDEEDLTSKKG